MVCLDQEPRKTLVLQTLFSKVSHLESLGELNGDFCLFVLVSCWHILCAFKIRIVRGCLPFSGSYKRPEIVLRIIYIFINEEI